MEQDIKKKLFNKRAFISTAMFISGLCLPISGYMNHFYQFDNLSQPRHFWMAVHDVAGILFVIFSVLHIVYNWKALVNYAKKTKETYISKETLFAIILVILVISLFSSHTFHVN
jgi:succinate dehydrogenase/fumarate reductase cytochrome b subunit